MTGDAEVFRLLQVHLDRQAIGFPPAGSGADLRLLKHLFSPEEATLALQLSFRPSSLAEILQRAGPGISAGEAKGLLDRMVMKGAIGWREREGVDQWFLYPLIVGFFETSQDGVPAPKFLGKVRAYLEQGGFAGSFLASKPSQVRVVPIEKSIPVEHHVATYDQFRATIAVARGPFAALKCICREMKAMRGEPCKKTSRLETCLYIDDMAATALRRGRAREVSREEALSLVQQSEDDGLVLQPTNAQHPDAVCACCGCCCGLLALQKRVPRPADFWASTYQCAVDAASCSSCAACVPRCQVGALTVAEPNPAQIDLGRCIGCGLCVPSCPASALRLRRREPALVPPEDPEALYEEMRLNRAR
ncbi:MAG TPA: 4Fe-4S dicluster domain-containing protein [Anaeromyxobacteraceae bacterium]|nr:4Fe-4S dicluster domain-containing protein [Anaeromyxobacteraceae bacterium]